MLVNKIARFNLMAGVTKKLSFEFQEGHGYTIIAGDLAKDGGLYEGLTLKGAINVVNMAADMHKHHETQNLRQQVHFADGKIEYWMGECQNMRTALACAQNQAKVQAKEIEHSDRIPSVRTINLTLLEKGNALNRVRALGWAHTVAVVSLNPSFKEFITIHPFDMAILFEAYSAVLFTPGPLTPKYKMAPAITLVAYHGMAPSRLEQLMDILQRRYMNTIRVATALGCGHQFAPAV